MKYVLAYENGPDTRALAPVHFEEHRAWFMEFHRRGLLLMVGPFVDEGGGAISVFTTKEAAEEFVAADPFVTHGVVGSWRIREWREALVP